MPSEKAKVRSVVKTGERDLVYIFVESALVNLDVNFGISVGIEMDFNAKMLRGSECVLMTTYCPVDSFLQQSLNGVSGRPKAALFKLTCRASPRIILAPRKLRQG